MLPAIVGGKSNYWWNVVFLICLGEKVMVCSRKALTLKIQESADVRTNK